MFQESVTKAYNLRDATMEILLMLLGAFILGYLLRLFMNRFKGISAGESMLSVFGREYADDDLKIVEGIGPKIEELLHAGGITTWAALASTEITRIQEILSKAGDRFKMHDPSTWAEQAGLARDNKWTELKKYQDFLVGGK
jgi:hypothetical protein